MLPSWETAYYESPTAATTSFQTAANPTAQCIWRRILAVNSVASGKGHPRWLAPRTLWVMWGEGGSSYLTRESEASYALLDSQPRMAVALAEIKPAITVVQFGTVLAMSQ